MIAMKAQELAELTGLSYRRVKQIDDAQPEGKKLLTKIDGGYDAIQFVQTWVEYNVGKVRKNGELNLEDEKALHEQLKREKTAMELERLRGESIPLASAMRVFGDIVHTATQRFLGLPTKLARTLVMVEDAELIEATLDMEIRETLGMLSDTEAEAVLGGEKNCVDGEE